MKKAKLAALALVTAFASVYVLADVDVMQLILKDGSSIQYDVAEIDGITFETICKVNDHDYVDLGLPSGLKWATCNVGASSPTEYGDYYAWGETETRETYSSTTSVWYNVSTATLASQGVIDESGNLTPRYDVATVKWGKGWRMPSQTDMQELLDNCTWTWTAQEGINGYEITGPNGNTIFLPAAGAMSDVHDAEGERCSYWSSTPGTDNYRAYHYRHFATSRSCETRERGWGYTVRPVTMYTENKEIPLDAPQNVNAIAFDGNITVVWEEVDDAESYSVFRAADGGVYTQIGTSNTEYYVDESPALSTYRYCVVANAASDFVGSNSVMSKPSTQVSPLQVYTDLGLPSGTKWAIQNMGATKPSDYGDYYCWAETETKDDYNASTYFTGRFYITQLQNDGIIVNGNVIPEHDAATANWGESWHMPDGDQVVELVDNCSWLWTNIDGHNGYVVTGPNGNTIFLPAANVCSDLRATMAEGPYAEGFYRSSTRGGDSWGYESAILYIAAKDNTHRRSDLDIRAGASVRAVTETQEFNITPCPVNLQSTESEGASTITWDAVDGATSYVLFKSTDGNNYTKMATLSGTTYVDNSPVDGANYYRVQAFSDKAPGRKSDVLKVVRNKSIAGHEYVDLGLPSGLKWATCNVGATTPSEYGEYYSWGETQPREAHSSNTCDWYNIDKKTMQLRGVIDNQGTLTSQYDAASVNWSTAWRMPTQAEMQELIDYCTWTWSTLDGVNGAWITGPNGNTLFLPAAGGKESAPANIGTHCMYWSSTPDDNVRTAYRLRYYTNTRENTAHDRGWGYVIRPVSDIDDDNSVAAPRNVRAVAFDGNITTTWNVVDNAASYIVYRSTDGDNFSQIGTTTTNYYVDTTPTSALNYYSIKAVSLTGATSAMSPASLPENPSQVYVDLGLPSGVKWAETNVGAATPSAFGDLFAWGDPIPGNGEQSPWYNTQSRYLGEVVYQGHLSPAYDPATVNWGPLWYQPTSGDFVELIQKCTWKIERINGHKGYTATGPNGNSIFLPFFGPDESKSYDASCYWSSTPSGESTTCSYAADLREWSQTRSMRYDYRSYASPVRPVNVAYESYITPQPINVQGEIAEASITLTWGDVQGADSYVVYHSADGETFTQIGTSTSATYTHTSPIVGRNRYTVQALGNGAPSRRSAVLTINTQEANGTAFVDLGLPSRVMWAETNVGAVLPEDYGNLYSWGETATKKNYYMYSSQWKDKTNEQLELSGVLASGALTPAYDVANVTCQGDWRMPTYEEFAELRMYCSWEWTTRYGVNGALVTGPNGNSIFLPAAGMSNANQGELGRYWTSTPNDTDDRAWAFYFDENDRLEAKELLGWGFSVRPVIEVPERNSAHLKHPNNVNAVVVGDKITLSWDPLENCSFYNIYESANGADFREIRSQVDATNFTLWQEPGTYMYRIQGMSPIIGSVAPMITMPHPVIIGDATGAEVCESVDLGLPSGIKWATCNVGADKPTDMGDYFAWGETSAKHRYVADNYSYHGANNYSYAKLQESGVIDESGNLTSLHDAATVNMGSAWRMPTMAEEQELIDNCTWTWTTINGHAGYLVTGPNGNSIFLPSAGIRSDDGFGYCSDRYFGTSIYWSATSNSNNSYVNFLTFTADSRSMGVNDAINRYSGRTIRAVTDVDAEYALPSIRNFKATVGSTVMLSWDAIAGATSYSVFHSTDGEEFTLIADVTNNSYSDGKAVFGTNYYRVRANGRNGAHSRMVQLSQPVEIRGMGDHEMVDLGLPSGLKWATCNIGANAPEVLGDRFTWGNTEPGSSSNDNLWWQNTPTSQLIGTDVIDQYYNLTPQYDAATVNWGSAWRMPTDDDYQELLDCCTWTWTKLNSKDGFTVTGPNGNTIFMPVSYYWAATALTQTDGNYSMWFEIYNRNNILHNNDATSSSVRSLTKLIRPVTAASTVGAIGEPRYVHGTATSISEINLEWHGVPGAVSYTVYRSTDGESFAEVTTVTDTQYTDTGLTRGHYYYRVQAHTADGIDSPMSRTSLSISTMMISGHEYEDLGLPSGLLWATCNIGTNTSYGIGDYYAWGETETKDDYSYESTPYYLKTPEELRDMGIIDALGNLRPEYDAAAAKWGSSWRMPNLDDYQELIDCCSWEWTEIGTVYGYKITGPNGRSIFLPGAGEIRDKEEPYVGSVAYSSATAFSDFATPTARVKTLYNNGSKIEIFKNNIWGYGYNVRPVAEVRPDNDIRAPRNIRITPVENEQNLVIRWDEVPGANQYIVYHRAYGSDEFTEVGRCSYYPIVVAVPFPDSGEHYYRVRAVDYNGEQSVMSATVTINMGIGSADDHDYVDLGLPSGRKWATCNIGSKVPIGNGRWLSWIETPEFSEDLRNVTPGDLMNRGIIDANGRITEDYDAARTFWGSRWRMPTKEDFEELIEYCTVTESTEYNNCYKFTGPNGNYLYFVKPESHDNYWWSSDLTIPDPSSAKDRAWCLDIYDCKANLYGRSYIFNGYVRPVLK